MLEYLEIENAGPADHLRLDFAPRLNLLTGDNGLGKSFLLDVAWWIFAQSWLSEINPDIFWGLPVIPHKPKDAYIKSKKIDGSVTRWGFQRVSQRWFKEFEADEQKKSITLYSNADGNIAIMDPYRNFRKTEIITSDGGFLRHSEPYVISPRQAWEGIYINNTYSQIFNGLINDWSSWQREKNSSFEILKNVLRKISPDDKEILEPGNLVRVDPDDPRYIPTLKMPFGEVPVLFLSSGVRRIITLAYLLVWTWEEHLYASQIRGLYPVKNITLLLDEIDAHLHPKWQRTIVESLMEVMKVLAPEVKVQIIAATHSPLVMASVEPFFDPEQDAWFDLDLNRETGQVEVTKRSESWYRRGDADAWLKSEAFDQKSGYALETEKLIERAGAALQTESLSRAKALEIDAELRQYLAESDPFLKRWEYIAEKKGWLEE